MFRQSTLLPVAIGLLACCVPAQVHSQNDKPKGSATATPPATAKEALRRFNPVIGSWRGVGQPRRGSASGAWSEKANWTWQFKSSKPPAKDKTSAAGTATVAIRFKSTGSKLIVDGVFAYDPSAKLFTLQATMADKTKRNYTGKPGSQGALVLESKPDGKGQVHRLTIRALNSKRTLVLHERRRKGSTFYTRVAGIGYTRAGTRLATANIGPLCIVTEGKGTSKVSYKGKTYWVCCSGCRDAFLDDPEGVLADARERAAEKKKKASKK
ncbi:MAG: hypothetical protein VX669_09860 [Planctomycetota bacterium]|nr:hypothetical protein [Planctomycetota bacterium]